MPGSYLLMVVDSIEITFKPNSGDYHDDPE